MSQIDCPNNAICKSCLVIVDNEMLEDGRHDNKIFLGPCKLKRNPLTNKHTLIELEYEIPVCWGCKTAYNDEDDNESNVYLSFIDSIECCICLKTDSGVSFPHCEHYTCIACHNRCWFGPTPVHIEFPYPDEIKKLYFSDRQNEIWKKDPKIKEYIERDNKAEQERMDQWESEINLRKCPLCRQ
jgi:hypothetical protein